jgi:plastocyanin
MLAVLFVAAPARAAGHTVTLSNRGPSPSALTIALNDTVTFRAGDASTYHVRRSSGPWTFSATVTSSKPVTTSGFGTAGTYGYTVTFDTLLGESPPVNGSITVPAAPTPTPTPSASSSPSARPRPTTTASAQPSATPSPSASPSGVAVPPPIIGGVVPTPGPTPSGGPAPQVAAHPTALSPTPAANVDYAKPSEIVQRSAHGFGLPAALAAVAAVGVVSLIVRILLASPEARPGVR